MMTGQGRRSLANVAAAVALALVAGACGSGGSAGGTAGTPPAVTTRQVKAVTERDFDRGNFSNSAQVSNQWLPLAPGTQFLLEGRANRGRGRLPHHVVLTVTDLTKTIDGVRSLVLWDRDYNEGQLVEAELAFHAQDDDGNVWNLGEYPEEYENGKFQGAPSTWLAGLAGAKAGIVMRADPQAGTSRYLQGYAPKVDFSDVAKVLKTGQRSCIPLRCYENVLVIDESNPYEPGAHQLKYYAPGVGNIRVEPVGGEEKEVLVLVKVTHLSAPALARARAEALKLDKRAYAVTRDLYRQTPPAERALQAGQSP